MGEVVITAGQARAIVRAVKRQNTDIDLIVSDDGGDPITVEVAQTGQAWEITRDELAPGRDEAAVSWQGQIGTTYVEFACPAEGCDFRAVIPFRGMSSDRVDPGYLDGDPPEECPECGAIMEGVDGHDVDPDDGRDYDSEPGGADWIP